MVTVSTINGNSLKRSAKGLRADIDPLVIMRVSYNEWIEDSEGDIIKPKEVKNYRFKTDGNVANIWMASIGDPVGGTVAEGTAGIVTEIEAVLIQPDPQAYIDAVEASLD